MLKQAQQQQTYVSSMTCDERNTWVRFLWKAVPVAILVNSLISIVA